MNVWKRQYRSKINPILQVYSIGNLNPKLTYYITKMAWKKEKRRRSGFQFPVLIKRTRLVRLFKWVASKFPPVQGRISEASKA